MAVLARQSVGLKAERHGWQRIKNHREWFLTTPRVGLKGERHGWQRIKNRPKAVFFKSLIGSGCANDQLDDIEENNRQQRANRQRHYPGNEDIPDHIQV